MECLYNYKNKLYTKAQLLTMFNSPVERMDMAREWLKTNTQMTDEDFLPIVKGLIDNNSLGRMLEDGKMLLSNLTPEHVLYHEAFHRIFNFFATDEERVKLISEFKSRKNYMELLVKMNATYNNQEAIDTRRGRVLTEEDLIEEHLAEEFQEFVMTNGKSEITKEKRSIFQKILDWLLGVQVIDYKLKNPTFTQQFYMKINDGGFRLSPRLRDKISAYRDSSLGLMIPGYSNETSLDLLDTLHVNFISTIIDSGRFYDIVDGEMDSFDEIFKEALDKTKTEVNEDIKKGLNARYGVIKSIYAAKLKEFKIDVDKDELYNYFDDVNTGDSNFKSNSIDFDPKLSMQRAVRFFLTAITTEEVNSVGGKKVVPVKQVNAILLRNLSNVPGNYEDFVYALRKISNKYGYINKVLSVIEDANYKGDNRFLTDFINSFNNSYNNFDIIAPMTNGSLKSISSNEKRAKESMISTWSKEFQDNININDDILGSLIEHNITGPNSAKLFFEMLGVEITVPWQTMKDEALKIQSIIKREAAVITEKGPKSLLNIYNAWDKTFLYDKEDPKSNNLSYIFSSIAERESRERDDLDIMIFNAEGKPLYPVTQYNYLSMTAGWINFYRDRYNNDKGDNTLEEDERSYPSKSFATFKEYLRSKMPHIFNYNSQTSYMLDDIINDTGNALSFGLINGLDMGDGNRVNFKEVSDLDYYVSSLKLFESGKIMSLTQGDRQIFPTFTATRILSVGLDELSPIFRGYINSEMLRIYNIRKNANNIANIKGLEKSDLNIMIDPSIYDVDLLYKSIEDQLNAARNTDEVVAIIDRSTFSVVSEINAGLDNFLDKQTDHYLSKFRDLKIVKTNSKGSLYFDESDMRPVVLKWFVNTYFGNIEQFKLLYGDLANFNVKNPPYAELWKRLNTPTSTGKPMVVSEDLLGDFERFENLQAFEVNGEVFDYTEKLYENGVDKGTVKEQFLKDNEVASSEFEDYRAIAESNYRDLYESLDWKARYKSIFPGKKPDLEELLKFDVDKHVKAYSSINEADGLSYINLFEWRRMMIGWSLWTPKHDNIFNTEMEVLKLSMDNSLSKEEKQRKFNDIFSSSMRDIDNYMDVFEQASLLKPQYAGPVYTASMDKYREFADNERANIYGIRKTSFMPLLPSVVFNTNLETLHHKMLNSGTGIVFFESAAKVGIVKKDFLHDVNNVISTQENNFETLDGKFTTFLDYTYMKNQLYISSTEKSKIVDATQSRKNIIADKYHEEVPLDFIVANKSKGFKATKAEWEKLSDTEKLEQSELHRDVEAYVQTLSTMIDRNRNILLDKFNIVQTSADLENFEVKDIKRIVSLLKDEARSRGNTIDLLDSFEYILNNPDGTLLNVFPNISKLQSLLASIVTSGAIKIKRIGSDYAQVSPVFFEEKGTNRKDLSKSNPETLRSYKLQGDKSLSPAEIIIPAPKVLLSKIEKAIEKGENSQIMESYNRIKANYSQEGFNIKLLTDVLNDLIDVGYLDKEVTFKALRIPNQELSSNEVFKVKKFMIPSMSKFVVISSEIVAKTGSDFDIDKLHVYFKHLDENLKQIEYNDGVLDSDARERFDSQTNSMINSTLENLGGKNGKDIGEEFARIRSMTQDLKRAGKEIKELNKEEWDEFIDATSALTGEDKKLYNEALNDSLEEVKQFISPKTEGLNLTDLQAASINSAKNIFELREALKVIRADKESQLGPEIYNMIDERNRLLQVHNRLYDNGVSEDPDNRYNPLEKIQGLSEAREAYMRARMLVENTFATGYPEYDMTMKVLNNVRDYIERIKLEHIDYFSKQKAISSARVNASEVLEQLNTINEEFKKIASQKESLKDRQFNIFKSLPIEYQNSMDAIYNKLSDVEQRLILNKANHANLLHPVEDAGLRDLLLNKIEPIQDLEERYSTKEKKSMFEALLPENNLNKKNELREADIGIGQHATHGTAHAISRLTKLGEFLTTSGLTSQPIQLSTELQFVGYENFNDFSKYFTEDLESIAQIISGLLTTQVDAAKDPYATYLNIKRYVNPVISYMLRRGVSKNVIFSFLTQPAIIEFVKNREIFSSPIYRQFNRSQSSIADRTLQEIEHIIGGASTENVREIAKIDPDDLTKKSMQKDKAFQKNVMMYFLSLREQAKAFNDYRKLMSSDTSFHKSLNTYKDLITIKENLEASGFIANLDEMLNNGFIKSFTDSAKLYYFPWKSMFLSTRDFGSGIGLYMEAYSRGLAKNLRFSDEKRLKLKDNMERQFIRYLTDNFSDITLRDDTAKLLQAAAKEIKSMDIAKVLIPRLEYGKDLKRDIIQPKIKSLDSFELNNYISFMKRVYAIKVIKVSNMENISGETLVTQLYLQSLKQSKNSFSPFDFATIIPGELKTRILKNILNEFFNLEKNGNFAEIFKSFMQEFQLNNGHYISKRSSRDFLSKDYNGIISDAEGNNLNLKGNSYTSDFNINSTEKIASQDDMEGYIPEDITEDKDETGTAPWQDSFGLEDNSDIIPDQIQRPEDSMEDFMIKLQNDLDKLKTVRIENGILKNLFFSDNASFDKVNGYKSFIAVDKLEFEGDSVYLKSQTIVNEGQNQRIEKTKIGTFEKTGDNHLNIKLFDVKINREKETKPSCEGGLSV